MAQVARPSRRPLALALAAALGAGCSSGTGHTPPPPPPPPPPPDDCTLAPAMPPGQPFTVSGVATYDFVKATYNPATQTGGLTLATPVPTPIRGADVQVRQCGKVLAGATTDPVTGAYSVTFTPLAQGRVAVYVLARTASPPITVQDNTDGNAVWAVGAPITSTSTPATLNVRATLGWTGAGYDSYSRIAAPFAILDDLFTASRRLLDDASRPVPFADHPIAVNWSPLNQPSVDSRTGDVNLPAGLIGTSHYDPSTRSISILGAYGVDTDEFDREVIVHEWGHYFEDAFSRADTPGGEHSFGDVLDPRLAFSEGWASGFAAIMLQDRIYADSGWYQGHLTAFGWDVETEPAATDDPSPGPFSEMSVIRAVWDLYDPVPPGVTESWDTSTVSLGAIYDALVGPQRTTPALTTLASFVTGLKAQAGVDATAVDSVLAHYQIGPITSDFGGGDPNLSGIYTSIAAPSGTPYTVSPTPTLNGSFAWNERPQNQYFVFTATGTHASFVATPAGPYDVDLYALQAGSVLAWDERSYVLSTTANVAFGTLPGATYVIVLTGWGGLSSYQGSIGSYGVTLAVSN